MKKLNRKGFTLVELLAVIVILAIVVGIAIPSVTSVINSSKKRGLETAVEAAGAYLEKQAQLMNVDASSVDAEFKTVVGNTAGKYHSMRYDAIVWKKLGLKKDNVSAIKACYDDKGKAKFEVLLITQDSEYYTVGDWVKVEDPDTVMSNFNKAVDDTNTYYTPDSNKINASYGIASCS